jgi:hypothetical protein
MPPQLHNNRRPIQAGRNHILSIISFHALIIGHVLLTSEFLVIFGETSRFVVSLILACTIGYFFLWASFQLRLFELTIFAAIIFLLIIYTVSYAENFNRELNFSTLLQWYGVLSFIAFSYFLREGMLEFVVKVILLYAVIYSGLYLIGAYLLFVGALDAFLDTHLVLTNPDRVNRLFLAQFIACFGFMYSLMKLKQRFSIFYLLTSTITLAAIVVSFSRVFIAVVFLVSAAYIFTSRIKLIGLACFALFVIVSLYLAYGLLDPQFSPFSFGAGDESALQRDLSFSVMRPFIMDHPILGVGLPNNRDDLIHLIGPGGTPADLGLAGIWFLFGLVGVTLYIYSAFICCRQKFSSGMADEAPSSDALILTGDCIGLYACISPNIWGGSGSIFFGLAIATVLHRLLLRQRRPFMGRRHYRKNPQFNNDTYSS